MEKPMQTPSIVVYIIVALCVSIAFSGESREGIRLGQHEKMLKPCPSSPNCVSSQTNAMKHRMEPIPFAGPIELAQARLREVIQAIPRSKITEEEPGYLAVSFRSRIFGFIDEAEFSLHENTSLVHFRSGACSGYYDFGVNRSRMLRIAESFREAR
jgi:uncharacterized protein (DUF1499 family)